jgi:protein gp37
MEKRFSRQPKVTVFDEKAEKFLGQRVFNNIRIHPERLDIPLKRKKPTVYAVWNDLFHEEVPDEFIQAAYMRMWNTQQKHIYLVLTKRIDRARYHYNRWMAMKNVPKELMCPQNIWLGCTVCTPDELWKMDELRKIPAAVHWVSFEPLLADLGKINLEHIDLCVLGGETGPGARPMHPAWARSVRDQCQAAGVPFFFKQWGEWAPHNEGSKYRQHCWNSGSSIRDLVVSSHVGKKAAGRLLDGREYNELPEVKG